MLKIFPTGLKRYSKKIQHTLLTKSKTFFRKEIIGYSNELQMLGLWVKFIN
jgi:hypothetical protein